MLFLFTSFLKCFIDVSTFGVVLIYIGLEVCWKRLIFTATMIYFIIAIIWIVAFSVYTVGKFNTVHTFIRLGIKYYNICMFVLFKYFKKISYFK